MNMKLKEELKRAGVRLKELADFTGESQSTISRVLDAPLREKIEGAAIIMISKKISELKSWEDRYPDIKNKISPTIH
jgi:lambda repressor-like predicted transcriptional regulator